jgi:hypothetical protein
MATDYYQNYLQDIVGGMMPEMQKQKKGMYDYLLSNALRTGQSAASVAQGMRPYAEAAGSAAADAGVTAKKMALDQERFDIQQANWEKQFEQGQANWEASMKESQEQQDLANMMSMFEHTGWTPELLDALGYSGLDKARLLNQQGPSGGSVMGSGGGIRIPGTGGDVTVGRNHPLARNKTGMLYA